MPSKAKTATKGRPPANGDATSHAGGVYVESEAEEAHLYAESHSPETPPGFLQNCHDSTYTPLASASDKGQAKGRPRADLGQTKGRLRADLGQTKGRPRADQGQTKGRPRADLGQTKGRLRAGQGQTKGSGRPR